MTISYAIPAAGSEQNFTADPKIATALQTLLTWANGNVDQTNLLAALAQSAGVNQSGQTVKAAVNIATSESRTNTAYGTLTTPDQVTGIVLPSNGLLAVWYQATWQESVAGAARAAIFLGANQLQVASTASGPQSQAAGMQGGAQVATNRPLTSAPLGLVSHEWTTPYAGDVTTGQVVGVALAGNSGISYDVGGTVISFASGGNGFAGGPCVIFAAAGTYTVSVQFKASSGSVTAANRKLWVQAISFA